MFRSKAFWAAVLALWGLALLLPRPEPVQPGHGHPNWPPQSFAVYYGRFDHARLKAARQFAMLIVHPGKGVDALNAEVVRRLRVGRDGQADTADDALVLAYLSLGEDEDPPRGPGPRSARFLDRSGLVMKDGFPAPGPDGLPVTTETPDGIPDRNGAWGSYYVNPADEDWRRLLLARAHRLADMHVDGFLLDTLDAPSGIYADLQPAMLDLLALLRREFPAHFLVANRGIELLRRDPDRYLQSLDGVLLESWFTVWDWNQGKAVVSPYAEENQRLLKSLLLARPQLQRFYLDYLDPDQPDRGAFLARRRGFEPGYWGHPFLQRLQKLELGPQRVLPPPLLPTVRWTSRGQLQAHLPEPAQTEVDAMNSGSAQMLPTMGGPSQVTWSVGPVERLRVRRLDRDGNSSPWLEMPLPAPPVELWSAPWTHLDLDREVQVSWGDGGEAELWTGSNPWTLKPSGLRGSSPLHLKGLESGELVWIALSRPGQGPGVAAACKTRDVTPPPPPRSASARWHGGRLTVSWTPVEAEDLAGYRVYVTEAGQPLALPYEVPVQENTEVSVPQGSYDVKVTSFDTGNHESAPCQADWDS